MNLADARRIGVVLIFGIAAQVGPPLGACSGAEGAFLVGQIRSRRGDQVRNSRGVSRAYAKIYARSESGECAESVPNANEARFSLSGLPSGVVNLLIPATHFAGESFRPKRVWGIDLKSGLNEVNFTVLPGTGLERVGTPISRRPETAGEGWIEGTVRSPQGVPVWGAKDGLEGVRLRLKGARMVAYPAETRLDADGFYEAHGLIPGKYEVAVPPTYCEGKVFKAQTLRGILVQAGCVTLLDIEVSEQAKRKAPVIQSIPIRLVEPEHRGASQTSDYLR